MKTDVDVNACTQVLVEGADALAMLDEVKGIVTVVMLGLIGCIVAYGWFVKR